MTPKELHNMLGISGNRIKYFKRKGLFIPENPTKESVATNYTQKDYERLRKLVVLTAAGLTCGDISSIETGDRSFEEVVMARIELNQREIETRQKCMVSLRLLLDCPTELD